MAEELADAIARYKRTNDELMRLVARNGLPPSDEEIREVDNRLASAFAAILDHRPEDRDDRLMRVGFLLKHLVKTADLDDSARRICTAIYDDAHLLAAHPVPGWLAGEEALRRALSDRQQDEPPTSRTLS